MAPVSIWVSLLSEVTTKRMKVSREGVVLIKSFAGFRSRAVQCSDGRWLIGYGHTASARQGQTVSEADAELLLQYDLIPVVRAINTGVPAAINQHQFDALASFALSIGVDRFLGSDVLHRLNAGLADQAADALIGWPEPTPPDTVSRRRAAERALFVADPARPIHLVDLLSAPLPVPSEPGRDSGLPTPVSSIATRAAAVATLLGEAEPIEPQPVDTGNTGTDDDTAAPTLAVETAPAVTNAPAVIASVSRPSMLFQRYTPYGSSIIGPLPGVVGAPVAPPLAGTVTETPPAPEPEVAQPDPAPAPPAAGPVSETVAGGADPVEPASVAPAPVAPAPAESVPVDPAPVVQPFGSLSSGTTSGPVLVLTPSAEEGTATDSRPVWPDEQRVVPVANQETLFDDVPASPVLRHEVRQSSPRRFDWSQTGAFVIMGGVGLVASASSAAAFRFALEHPSPMGETTVVAWVLAVIGGICVVVSSVNLYGLLGRSRTE
tara:strand:+ start:4669 stop:6141 length:1473 start_codon:yes stop_codon:yes gene_type:complete